MLINLKSLDVGITHRHGEDNNDGQKAYESLRIEGAPKGNSGNHQCASNGYKNEYVDNVTVDAMYDGPTVSNKRKELDQDEKARWNDSD
jgi:hypothetical protein